MKTRPQTIVTALCLSASMLALAQTSFAQGDSQLDYNREYRSEYDVPPGKYYTGRSPFMQGMKKETLPPAPAPKVVAAAKPAPAPAPAPVYSGGETCWGLVKLAKRAPAAASVGETFAYDLTAVANCDVVDVVIKDMLPANATYVKSEPAGAQDGASLVWKIAKMQRGETQNIRVWVTAQKVGEVVNCASVTAVPIVCVTTVIGKPELAITKTGPETALLGADVTYTIVVKNTGNSVAKDVVVTDAVPEGLVHATGQKEISFNVGDLAAGASKSIPVTFKTDRRGKVCNPAVATSSNTGKVNAEACTVVVKPGIKITKVGDKMQYLGKVAKYQINVANTGDTTLSDVIVTDTAPAGNRIVSAGGANVTGSQAVWNVGTLAPGASKSLDIALTTGTAGEYCNKVGVSTAQGLRDAAEACTVWKGISGILLEKADDPDPVQVGEGVTYTVKVTNQGSADDTNVKMVVTFPREVTPVSAVGGTVNGQTVTFPAVARLAPKQAVAYTIKAKGANPGDARTTFTLNSDELKTPVVAEESTTIY